MTSCRACQAPIRFARHVSTGKAHPVDAKPSQDGDLVLYRSSEGVLMVRHVKLPVDELSLRFKSHFATCSKPDQFRRRRS